ENVVRDNRVSGSDRYGIAVFPTARRIVFDPGAERNLGAPWRPRGNRIVDNEVRGSGRADLALAAGSGPGNCFSRNSAGRTLPRVLQLPACVAPYPGGERAVASELGAPVRVM